MVKRLIRIITTAAILVGMSTVAMAELKISGDVAEYLGQYNDGTNSYLTHFGEGHLKANYSEGKVGAYVEIELRDEGATGGSVVNNAQKWVSYQATKDLSVKMGSVVNSAGTCFGKNSGISTTRSKSYADFLCIPTRTEVDGLQVTYKISALKGKAQVAILPESDGNIVTAGGDQAIAMGLDSKLGDNISLKVGVLTAGSDSANNIGAKMAFGDMSVSIDVSSSTIGTDASYSIAQFKKKSLGPGGITVTLGSESKSSTSYTSALYKIGLENNVALDLFVLSKSTSAVSATNIGGGLVIKF